MNLLFRSPLYLKIHKSNIWNGLGVKTCWVDTTLALILRWFSYLWQIAIRPRLSRRSRISGSLTMLPLPPLDKEARMIGKNAGISRSRVSSGSSCKVESESGRLTTTRVESLTTNFLKFRVWVESSRARASVVLKDLFESLGEANLYLDDLDFFGDSPMGLFTV